MARPKYNTKPDSNQAEIVNELRSLGFDVDVISALPRLYDIVVSGEKIPTTVVDGKGFYRCICSVRGEIKSEDGLFTDEEIEYYILQRHKESYLEICCVQDVIDWFDGK